MDNDVMVRQPAPFAALCALPGAVVMRDERRGIITVTFRGDYAGQGDLTVDDTDAMLTEAQQAMQAIERRAAPEHTGGKTNERIR